MLHCDADAALGDFTQRTAVRAELRRNAWVILIFMTAMLAALQVFRQWFPRSIEWFNEGCSIVGPLIGAAWCVRRRRGRPDSVREPLSGGTWSSIAFAAGIISFSCGELVLAHYLLQTKEAPTPSPADAFFIAAYPFFIAGILLLPARAHFGLARARVLVDSLMTMMAATAISGYFLLVPMLAPIDDPLIEKLMAAAYPIFDLVLLFCLLIHSARTAVPRQALLTLCGGLLAVIVSDTVYGWQVLHGTYQNGNIVDLGWPLGYMLIGLGVRTLRILPEGTGEAMSFKFLRRASASLRFGRAALPYASIIVVGAMTAYAVCVRPSGHEFIYIKKTELYVGCVVVGLLLVIRQLLVILENNALNVRLRGALADLESGHTTLAAAHQTLQHSEERFRIAARSVGDLIYEWDISNETIQWFGDVDGVLGYPPGKFSRTFKAWEDAIVPADRIIVADRLARHFETGEPFILEYRINRADGETMVWMDRGSVIRDADGKPLRMIGGISDVTEHRISEYRFRHASLHDTLTGLPNRELFNDRVGRCIERASRTNSYNYAVLFLDLDRFKIVNDSLGHAAGDTLLKAVAERLNSCLRGIDTVSRIDEDGIQSLENAPQELARLGGDEFTILLDELANPNDAGLVADRILAALAEPLKFEGHEISSTASIGIALGSPAYESAVDLLRDADAAMYHAKGNGRGRYVLFDASMREAAIARLQLETDLRKATDNGDLRLHYQPIIDLQNRKLVGFEALVRWVRDGKTVSPADFIPVAEETGLILQIGAWVLAEASSQLRQWRMQEPDVFADVSMSVNLSRRQLKDPLLLEHIADARKGFASGDLKLEITESLIMADDAFEVMQSIRSMGMNLSMDDFGTGYSSLSCLHRFPIQELKIDRSFVAQLSNGREYAAVVQAIVALAHNLNIRVVAEGLETAEQVALLQALDCDFGQGYFFARPMIAAEVVTFARHHVGELRAVA